MKLKRMTAALLLLVMLLSCLPLSVLAADAELVEAEETVDTVPAENTDAEVTTEEPVEEAAISTQAVNASGYFYFSAETANKLLIAPVRIAFTDGQTCRAPLLFSASFLRPPACKCPYARYFYFNQPSITGMLS